MTLAKMIEVIEIFHDIVSSRSWRKIELINRGWSNDKKYYIETNEGEKLLLRTSDIDHYEKKKMEYESISFFKDSNILMSKPIEFGICNNGKLVYSLLTWIEGEDAEIVLANLNNAEQYSLGLRAGIYLRQIHEKPAPKNIEAWDKRFNRKIDIKISNYKSCPIQFEGSDEMIKYIEENRHLLKNRPQNFQHGDYHVGNMIITPKGELGIIDFNRLDYGDPWEEFNRITFSVSASPLFASGCINGYFDNKVPDLFFRLMALYIATNQLSSVPWAITFGEKEVNIMLIQAGKVLDWYDDFKTYIPNWYVSRY